MSLRSDLGKVRGLGSAKDGTHHWWWQRLTAIALIPLSLWFVWSLLCVAQSSHAEITAWIAKPHVTVGLIALMSALFYHLKLGMQVVFEDDFMIFEELLHQCRHLGGSDIGDNRIVVLRIRWVFFVVHSDPEDREPTGF